MLNVVVMVSGGGTNLQAILDAVEDGRIRNTKICAVISNNAGAYALERAKNMGFLESLSLQNSLLPEKRLTRRFWRKWRSFSRILSCWPDSW